MPVLAARRVYVSVPEIAYFEPNLKIWPQGSIWTPRPQLLVPGGLPDVALMILQPMVDFEKGVGRVISGYLASSTLKTFTYLIKQTTSWMVEQRCQDFLNPCWQSQTRNTSRNLNYKRKLVKSIQGTGLKLHL